MHRSTSSIQFAFLGVNTEWVSSRREPLILLIDARAIAIWSLVRTSHVGSSNGAPVSSATFVSLSTKISLRWFSNLKRAAREMLPYRRHAGRQGRDRDRRRPGDRPGHRRRARQG